MQNKQYSRNKSLKIKGVVVEEKDNSGERAGEPIEGEKLANKNSTGLDKYLSKSDREKGKRK